MTREEFKDQVTKILWFESADQAAEAAGALWDEVRSAGWKAGPTVAVPEAFRRAIEADTAVLEATSGVTDWYRGVQAPEEAGVVWDEASPAQESAPGSPAPIYGSILEALEEDARQVWGRFQRERVKRSKSEVVGDGVQGPETKRLTVRQLGALAGCSASEGPEQWRGALRTAVALGYKIVPDEVELPGEVNAVGSGRYGNIAGEQEGLGTDGPQYRPLLMAEARAVAAWWGQRKEVAEAYAMLERWAEYEIVQARNVLRVALAAPARAARGEE